MRGAVRLSRLLNNALAACLQWLFFGMLALVALQVIGRIFELSLPWTEELSRLVFLYLVYVGAAVAFGQRAMITIDSLPQLSPRLWGWLYSVAGVLTFFIVVFFFYASIGMIRSSWNTTMPTIAFLSNGWAYVAFSLSFLLIALHMVVSAICWIARRGGAKE